MKQGKPVQNKLLYADSNAQPEDHAAVMLLQRTIDAEMNKCDDERDEELIAECIKEIAEIKGVRSEYDAEDAAIFAAIAKERRNLRTNDRAAKQRRARPGVLIAACLLVGVLTVILAFSVSPSMQSWVRDVLNLSAGDDVSEGGVTYTNMGVTVVYDTIEELMAAEKLGILYPAVLPEGVELHYVDRFENNGITYLNFSFNTDDFMMTIQSHSLNINSQNREVYTNDVGTFYLLSEDNLERATCIVNGYRYNITVNAKWDLKDILDNLKEFKS